MNILLNQKNNTNKSYISVSILGKSLKLDIKYRLNPIAEIDRKADKLELYLPKKYKTMRNVDIVNMAIYKMYDEIAQKELEDAMEKIRLILGFAPEDYKIKRMKDEFYRCLHNKKIIINPDIVKYSRSIIETTLIQAFCQIKYNKNSKEYREELLKSIEKYENYKYKVIKKLNIIERTENVG